MAGENGAEIGVNEGGSATVLDDSFAEAFFANEIQPGAAAAKPAEKPAPTETVETEVESVAEVKPAKTERGDDGKFKAKKEETAKKPDPKAEKSADPDDDDLDDIDDDESPLAGWDESIVADAKERGMSDEEIAAFGSDAALNRAMVFADRQNLAALRKSKTDEAAGAKPDDKAAADAGKAEAKKEAAPESSEEVIKKLELGLSDEYDEEVVGVLNKLNDHYHGQLESVITQNKQLRSQVEALAQFAQEFQNERLNQAADRFFLSLDETYADDVGKGSLADLSPELQQVRREIVRDALELAQLAADSGRKPMNLPKALNDALKMRFYDKHKEHARKEVAKKVAERKSQGVAKPTKRRQATGSPDDAASSFAERWYEERGLNDRSIEDELAVLGG